MSLPTIPAEKKSVRGCVGRGWSVIGARCCDEAGVRLFDSAEQRGGGGGWGADLASSEGMSETGILKECSHGNLSRRERGGLVG